MRDTQSVPATTAQYALEGLRRAVASGHLRPGQRIRQEMLATELGVSVAPVREALNVLEKEGQVSYQQRRGYSVAELDLSDLREIYELRGLLENRAVEAALPILDADALVRLEQTEKECASAAEADDVKAELDANRRFHFQLFETSGGPHVARLLCLLWDSTEVYRAIYLNSRSARKESTEGHKRILAALRDGDDQLVISELAQQRKNGLAALTKIVDS